MQVVHDNRLDSTDQSVSLRTGAEHVDASNKNFELTDTGKILEGGENMELSEYGLDHGSIEQLENNGYNVEYDPTFDNGEGREKGILKITRKDEDPWWIPLVAGAGLGALIGRLSGNNSGRNNRDKNNPKSPNLRRPQQRPPEDPHEQPTAVHNIVKPPENAIPDEVKKLIELQNVTIETLKNELSKTRQAFEKQLEQHHQISMLLWSLLTPEQQNQVPEGVRKLLGVNLSPEAEKPAETKKPASRPPNNPSQEPDNPDHEDNGNNNNKNDRPGHTNRNGGSDGGPSSSNSGSNSSNSGSQTSGHVVIAGHEATERLAGNNGELKTELDGLRKRYATLAEINGNQNEAAESQAARIDQLEKALRDAGIDMPEEE